jgi:hypothetical protein
MSDYLSNLAARSLEAVATIRPRLTSFYEAPQHGFALPAEPGEAVAMEGEAVDLGPAQRREARDLLTRDMTAAANEPLHAEDARPRTPLIAPVVAYDAASEASPRASSDEPSKPQPAIDHLAPFAASPAPPMPPPVADKVGHDAPRERRVRGEVAAPVVAADRVPDSVAYVEAVAARRIVEQIPPPQEARAAEPRHAETTTIAAASREPDARLETPAYSRSSPVEPARAMFADRAVPVGVTPRRERERTEPVSPEPKPPLPEREPLSTPFPHRITPSRIVVEPRQAPHVQPVPRSPRTHRQPPAAPDVHVTIGRVEVRAVPAAEPPSRSRSVPSSLMSLEDYLRKRGEGTRR